MNKPKEFEVKTLNEFQELVDKKHFSISQAIVSSILGNLKSLKKNIHMLSIKCLEDNTIYDITLEKHNFASTLQENLKYFEEREMYEQCAEINSAIKTLSKIKTS